jgi:hypothetical protein
MEKLERLRDFCEIGQVRELSSNGAGTVTDEVIPESIQAEIEAILAVATGD